MPLKELLKYNKDCIQRLDSRPHSQDILNVGFWILQGSRVRVWGAVTKSSQTEGRICHLCVCGHGFEEFTHTVPQSYRDFKDGDCK